VNSNFWIYLVGVVLVTGAVAYGAFALGVSQVWIGIGVVVFLGFGLMAAAKKAGMKDSQDQVGQGGHNGQNGNNNRPNR